MPDSSPVKFLETKFKKNTTEACCESYALPLHTRPMSEAAAALFGMQLGAHKCAAWARLGTAADGGWTVCLDPLLPALGLGIATDTSTAASATKSELKSALKSAQRSATARANAATTGTAGDACLVYSFGVGDMVAQTSFERAASALGCAVHMFDPFVGRARRRETVAPRLDFHALGIWHADTAVLRTLDSIAAQLGHANRTIDILKMDVEGVEWRALPQIFASEPAWLARGRVRQLLMEVQARVLFLSH
jgi:hypothetical protein